jgi:hypothetical protein
MSSSHVMDSFQLLQELQVAQMERLSAVMAPSRSGVTANLLTRSTGQSALRLDRYANLGPLVETDNETDGETSPTDTPFSSAGMTPKENAAMDNDRKRTPRTHSWNLDRSPMTEYNATRTGETMRSNQFASEEENERVNFSNQAHPTDDHNESSRESLVLLMSTSSSSQQDATGSSAAQHEHDQRTLEYDAGQASFSTNAAHFSPNHDLSDFDRSSMGRDSFDSTYTIPSIATVLRRDMRMNDTPMNVSDANAVQQESQTEGVASLHFARNDQFSAADPTSNGPSHQPPFPRLRPRDAVDTQGLHSVGWSSPLDATRRAHSSGILPDWRFSLEEHRDSSREALAFVDDTRSVDTSETPVLDRYQLATDDSIPHGFVVLPNPRRQHKYKGSVAIPHKSPFQRYSARRDEMEALQTVAEQSSSTDSSGSETLRASTSPPTQPGKEGEPEASRSTPSLPQEIVGLDSSLSPMDGPEDLRHRLQEWPRLRYITEPEYSAAPRLIKLQTTYEELRTAVSVLNDFLFRSSRTNASPSLTSNLTDSLLTTSAVHLVLGDTFPAERKRKSIIYALCHCQKMQMILPRSANEEVTYRVVNGNTKCTSIQC